MARPPTSEIVLGALVHVAPRFREITDLAGFQEVFPYRTVSVQDEVSDMLAPLPAGYTEHRLYVMNGPMQLGTVDVAFHPAHGLVNFSLFVIPREWFKRKAVKDCLRLSVFPFLRQNYPDAKMVPEIFGTYVFPDLASGLTFQVRPHLDETPCIGIGVAIIDSDHV